MRTRIQSLSALRTIVFKRRGHIVPTLFALMMTLLAVGTRAQEQHRKPDSAGGAELSFEPLGPSEAAAANSTVIYDFASTDPMSAIHNTTEIKIPGTGTAGIASPYPLSTVISGFQGSVGRLAVRLNNLTHTCLADLHILLVGPQGQKVVLMSAAGGCRSAEEVQLTFKDGAPKITTNGPLGGTFAPTSSQDITLPPPAPGLPYSTSLGSFTGTDPNGMWSLFVYDRALGDVGMLSGFTLIISPQFSNNSPTPLPDCGSPSCPPGPVAAIQAPVFVSGVTAPISRITLSFHITHTWDADLDMALIGPDNTFVPLVYDRGFGGDNFGTSCGNRTVLDDAAPSDISAGSAPFVGTFRPESPLAAFVGKPGSAANGTWRLQIYDDAPADVGTLQCWSLVIEMEEDTSVQAPMGLRASSIAGNEVTLRWSPPAGGGVPTNYVIEGGLNPGETLASLATNSDAPIHTFVAPTGSFFVRARAQAGNELGPPSNDIPLHVNVPAPPSAPGLLQGVTNGSDLWLAWRNTFEGGAPSSLILDVSGDTTASIPLPLTDNISFAGVPPGTYELRLRAANDSGVSDPGFTAGDGGGPSDNPLKVTIPDPKCYSLPHVPSRFLAYRLGNTVYVIWEPPASSWAATEYVLNVGGSYVGSFATTARALKGTAGPGTYHLSVTAKNPCGVSAPTPVQVVTVP